MTTTGKTPERGETRQYLVKCDGCSFERTTDSRDDATRIGSDHHRETTHELIALEVPPSIASS